MVGLINLFIVPVLSLGIHAKRNGYEERFSFRHVITYAAYVVIETIITNAIMYVLTKVIDVGVEYTSWLYTAPATVVAIIAPIIYELYKKYIDITCKTERK